MTATPLIHIVDDDESMRTALQRLLTEGGFQTRVYGSTGEFLLQPLPDQPACLLLDVRLPGPSGLELQAALQCQNVELPVIFLTGHADVASSVQAMKAKFTIAPLGTALSLIPHRWSCRQSTFKVPGMVLGKSSEAAVSPLSSRLTATPACRPMALKFGM